MTPFQQTLGAAVATFAGCLLLVPLLFGLARGFGVYVVVPERRCFVYVLFGKILAVIDEPGLHLLFSKLGWRALVVGWLGRCEKLDMRLDQEYLRSSPVNSEEGAPMGIGIWYEMFISDPVSYLFKNADPRGSLAANVSNSTVRCLSNMPLGNMLTTRHAMSNTVRAEVSPISHEWGYKLGSIYIRKVHFRDTGMIKQIESKVVNRPRQVTSGIKTGRRESSEHHHQHRRAQGRHRIRQSGRHPPTNRRRGLAGHFSRSGIVLGLVFHFGNAKDHRGRGAHHPAFRLVQRIPCLPAGCLFRPPALPARKKVTRF
jgi:hypothetical protein